MKKYLELIKKNLKLAVIIGTGLIALLTAEAQTGPLILRDPFKVGFAIEKPEPVEGGGPAPAPAPKILQLQGIFEIGDKKSAIIDDKMVSVGDTVSGWVITGIANNNVTVYRKGKTKVLYIKLGVY